MLMYYRLYYNTRRAVKLESYKNVTCQQRFDCFNRDLMGLHQCSILP